VDITYYGLRLLAALGLIWDLKPVPREVRDAHTAVTS
jgi:stearoyl-CoA desaturase (delta-9 desaturase)